MEDNKTSNPDIIDLRIMSRKIWASRKLFCKVLSIVFVLSCIFIFSIPRYYSSDAKLAPEIDASSAMGGLNSIASSFGINLNSMQATDAIYPLLYPDLMEDNGFVTSLFPIRVKTADGEIDTDYYTYLKSHQKKPWWGYATSWISNSIKSLFPKKEENIPVGKDGKKNPYWLSEADNGKAEIIRGNINIQINEKNGVVTITTKAQDPLVAKILADSVQVHIQDFIIDYRTSKARVDVEHYEELVKKARLEYEQLSAEYARYSEANSRIVLTSHQTKMENMQKEMQLKYTTYTTLVGQLEYARAKLQERTPAFSVLKGASVAVRPAGPKRVLFVLLMLILATMVTGVVILRKDLSKIIQIRRG